MDIIIANFYEWEYTEKDIIDASVGSLLQTTKDTIERISNEAKQNG